MNIWEYGRHCIIRNLNPSNSRGLEDKRACDYASINELICLSNMENINAVMINDSIPQKERLLRLNKIAIQQMTILVEVQGRKLLK